VLAAHRILSAPVTDAFSGEYVGMVDVGDLAAAVVKGEPP
jgi:CBS domain-containing protein